MKSIKTTQLNDRDENDIFEYNTVIQFLAGNKYLFERTNGVWIQIRKSTKEDEEKYPVVIDD